MIIRHCLRICCPLQELPDSGNKAPERHHHLQLQTWDAFKDNMVKLHDFFNRLADVPDLFAKLDGWSGWPFSGYGYEGGFWPVVARFALVAVFLGGIALVLRLLFGPKGPLRGEGWETIQEAKKRREAEQLAKEEQKQQQPWDERTSSDDKTNNGN